MIKLLLLYTHMLRTALLSVCILIAVNMNAQPKDSEPSLPMNHVDTSNYYVWTGTVQNKTRSGEWMAVNQLFKDIIHANYVNGKLNGVWTIHYNDGKLRESGSYVNNKRDGLWIKLDGMSDTIFYCTYSAGVLNGRYRTFTSHNKPTRTGYFKNGKREGTWIESAYTSEGKLLAETFYPFANDTLNGKLQRLDCEGTATTYFANGIIISESYQSQANAAYTCEEESIVPFQEMPQYPGGDAALQQYLVDSLRYPESCVQQTCSGNVFVQFTVDVDGRIVEAKIVRGISGMPELDAEALRIISAMPQWSPGKINGKTIPVKMTCPVKFKAY